jgi:NADH dehydrogenase FAD-containing subunit
MQPNPTTPCSIDRRRNARPRILILGGGYAGLLCALRLARQSQAEIHLVNASPRFVERIRLHQVARGQMLPAVSIPRLLRGMGVIFHVARATHLDWRTRTVTLRASEPIGLNEHFRLEYDRLVYALGSQTDCTTPGFVQHALTLEGLGESENIAARLAAMPAGSEIVVVGSGLTGTELVFELAESHPHLRWTLVTRSAHSYSEGYAPAARDYFLQRLAHHQITMRGGVEVQRVEHGYLVTDAGDLPFALCLWAGSFRGVPLGRESGLAVNGRDQLLVDATLRSLTTPEIYVVGDSAALPTSYQPHLVMGCKTAMPLGVHAAKNLLAEMRGDAPQSFSFGYQATCVSLGRHDGVVQMLAADGQPTPTFVRGRMGAWAKEVVCQATVMALRLERHFNFYDWVNPRPAPAQPLGEIKQVETHESNVSSIEGFTSKLCHSEPKAKSSDPSEGIPRLARNDAYVELTVK